MAMRTAAESSQPSAFRTARGKAAFLAAYDAAMALWPVPYEETDVPTRFGTTHVIVSGPGDGPPIVLLHGFDATSTMWGPNIADFSEDHRVYAVDVMGQPGKSVPTEPVRNAADYAAWIAETLDGLHLDRSHLVGQSFGTWLALNFALTAPDRLLALVLLSPGGGFVPMNRQFAVRGMIMTLFPSRVTVNGFMRWLGITEGRGEPSLGPWLRLMYLGVKHFRAPAETQRVLPGLFPDEQLRAMRVPTLILVGEHEVVCDPGEALARARRIFPDVQAEVVPGCSHDMCFTRHRVVDARVLEFLKRAAPDPPSATAASSARPGPTRLAGGYPP